MATRAPDPNIKALYRATFLFGMACGISIALTALHLDAHGYTKQNIGSLAAWFASGIVLMSLPAGALIRRFSAKYTLLTCLAGYAVCVTAFPFLGSYAAIAGVRFFDGACSVGIWVASETILLSRTEKENKAHLTSLYAIWLASGYVAGPVLAKGLSAVGASMVTAFVIAGCFAIASAIYVSIRLELDTPEPEVPSKARTDDAPESIGPTSAATILWRIKNSCFATYVYGYFQASVVLFLPLYLMESKGIEREKTIILPGLFCLGMLVCSNAAGRIADRVGHLLMMRALSFLGMLMVIGFIVLDAYLAMCVAVFIAGATFASMSPISLALQGVVTERKNYSRSNAIYNVFYAGGMLMGPPISSMLFQKYGGVTMLLHLAVLWAGFVLFSIVFFRDDPAVRKPAPVPAT